MFVLSKLLSAITQPLFWLAVWWTLALWLLGVSPRRHRTASGMLWAGLAVLGLLGFTAMPDALLRPLENRYVQPPAEAISRMVGLIVLGGATDHPNVFLAHGQVPLGEAAERMSAPVGLMRQHPHLQLVFSGGEGRLLATGTTEAELARIFYLQQGMDMARITLESGSRNTRENARQVAQLLGNRCKQPWLLVTSAWHMPRSMTEFQVVGCNVTPYPVDFRTGHSTPLNEYDMADSLLRWQTAIHEYAGMLAYALVRLGHQLMGLPL